MTKPAAHLDQGPEASGDRTVSPHEARSTAAGVGERLVFGVTGGLMGLNVLVDSFVAVRPGAERSDHILAAVIPLVLLAAALWLHPRMRPGLRACLALLFGALALVWGGLAGAATVQEGLSVGLMTGLLLIPAGIALLAMAVQLLWRSRKHGRLRYVRPALYLIAGLLVAYWVVLPLGIAAYATHRPRVWVAASEEMPDYREVTLTTRDGLELRAWYIPSENGAAVVTYPRETTVPHAVMLAEAGYGVLMVDMRGYGDSEGDPNAFGWGSGDDIDAAVAYLGSLPEIEPGRIGGLGLSVGGEQMIEAAATNDALAAVVSEGAGERSVAESLMRGPKGWPAVPAMAVQTAAVAVLSGDRPPASLGDLATRISPRPVFFIYAEHVGGGEELNPEYFRAAGQPKELWQVEDSGHISGIAAQPEEYEQRVIGFFDRWLLRR
jgi:uncharacterized protein